MTCHWESKISKKKCNRKEFENSGFCIYHKSNKDIYEGALFWGLMNYSYDNYGGFESIDTLYANLQQLKLLNEMDLDLDFEDDLSNKNSQEIEDNNQLDLHGFLSLSIDEFRNFFNNLLREKDVVQNEVGQIDFSGFCFPREPFNKLEVKNYFLENDRSGSMLFYENVFEGEANFQHLNFKQNVHFKNTVFNLSVNFSYSIFEQNCLFENVKFNDIYPISTISSFWKTSFEGLSFIIKNVRECIAIDGVNFSEDTNVFLENVSYSTSNLREGERSYRIAKQQATKMGDNELAGSYYFLERIYKGRKIFPKINWFKIENQHKKFVLFEEFRNKKVYKFIIPKLEDFLAKTILGYGEKPGRSLIFSLIIIFLFSIIFMFIGLQFNLISTSSNIVRYHFNLHDIIFNLIHLDIDKLKLFFHDYGNFLYFSIATFTTVGYGDITPCNFTGRIFSAIEMLLGITLAGIWVASLLRKMLK